MMANDSHVNELTAILTDNDDIESEVLLIPEPDYIAKNSHLISWTLLTLFSALSIGMNIALISSESENTQIVTSAAASVAEFVSIIFGTMLACLHSGAALSWRKNELLRGLAMASVLFNIGAFVAEISIVEHLDTTVPAYAIPCVFVFSAITLLANAIADTYVINKIRHGEENKTLFRDGKFIRYDGYIPDAPKPKYEHEVQPGDKIINPRTMK